MTFPSPPHWLPTRPGCFSAPTSGRNGKVSTKFDGHHSAPIKRCAANSEQHSTKNTTRFRYVMEIWGATMPDMMGMDRIHTAKIM